MTHQQVFSRSAIEALRSGVPSRHAVEQLGTTQVEIKDAFESRLQAIIDGQGVDPIVIAAGFGHGKSHLLNYLKALAANQGFVTSIVVVSPEVPLGNPHVVLKAIAEAAEAPDHTGRALRALARDLRTNSTEFAQLRLWSREAGMDDRFVAMLHLYEDLHDEELRTQILGDFEGSGVSLNTIRQGLKGLGQSAGYALKAKRAGLLAHDRIRLLSRSYRACGTKGWVILFDELERFTLFPTRQKLAVWEELGWWTEAARESGAAILPVFAGVHEALKKELEDDEPRFRSRNLGLTDDDPDRRALTGIQLIKKPIRLSPLDAEQEEQIKYRVKAIYEQAYGVQTLPVEENRFDKDTTVRSEIRRWITLWDLRRCYPDYDAEVVAEEVQHDTTEIADESVIADDDSEAGA